MHNFLKPHFSMIDWPIFITHIGIKINPGNGGKPWEFVNIFITFVFPSAVQVAALSKRSRILRWDLSALRKIEAHPSPLTHPIDNRFYPACE
jgi:hypothetical protein